MNEHKKAAGVPDFLPAGAIGIGAALVQHGDLGDMTAVSGLGVMIGEFGQVVVSAGDGDGEPPDMIGPDELERMAAFLIGVAGALRQKIAAGMDHEFAEVQPRPASPTPSEE